jgi:hypothetical protein
MKEVRSCSCPQPTACRARATCSSRTLCASADLRIPVTSRRRSMSTRTYHIPQQRQQWLTSAHVRSASISTCFQDYQRGVCMSRTNLVHHLKEHELTSSLENLDIQRSSESKGPPSPTSAAQETTLRPITPKQQTKQQSSEVYLNRSFL